MGGQAGINKGREDPSAAAAHSPGVGRSCCRRRADGESAGNDMSQHPTTMYYTWLLDPVLVIAVGKNSFCRNQDCES